MTREQISAMLSNLNVPVAYYLFEAKKGVAPPFCVWYLPENDNFSADGVVHTKISSLNIELYTDQKNQDLEETLENILDQHEIFWNKQEAYIDAEKMYQILYTMEVIYE